MKIQHIIIFIILLLSACKTKQDNNFYRDFSQAIPSSNLYNPDFVNNFVGSDEMAMWSAEYLAKANKLATTTPEKALYYAKRAVSLAPTKEGYLLLGNLLIQNNKIEEANNAWYYIIRKYCDQVDNAMFANYLYAVIKSSVGPYSIYGLQLLDCENKSISWEQKQEIKNIILKDARFLEIISLESYKEAICLLDFNDNATVNLAEEKTVAPFDSFAIKFPLKGTELSIGLNELQNFNYGNHEEYEYEGPGSYCSSSYLNFTDYYPEDKTNYWKRTNNWGQLNISDQFSTLIFAYDTSASATSGIMRCTDFKAVTYTNDGKIIDQRTIAIHAGEKLTTSILKDSIITLSTYKRTWKEPFGKYLIDNDIVETVLESTEIITINSAGYFKSQDPE